MNAVEEALVAIRRVVGELGTVEASRLSGVPYTTLHEAKKRNFTGPSIETLQRLATFAEQYEREHASADDRSHESGAAA